MGYYLLVFLMTEVDLMSLRNKDRRLWEFNGRDDRSSHSCTATTTDNNLIDYDGK